MLVFIKNTNKMFTSRRQKILKYFMILKEAELKNDKNTVNDCVLALKDLNLSKSEIEQLEIKQYLKNN